MTAARRVSIVSVLVLAAALTAGLQTEQTSDLSSTQDFSAATESREIEVEVSESARSISIRANVHLEQGLVRFQLLDPAGAERLRGAVTSGDAKWESGELPAVAGVWRARFELERASGNLRLRSRVR